MFNSFIQIFSSILIETFCLFVIFAVVSLNWKKISAYFSLKSYQTEHRLHQDEVPRVAGGLIYIFLIFVAFFSTDSHYLNVILISALPIVLIGIKEDLFQNTTPKLRLIMMIISAGLLINLLPSSLPKIDFHLVNEILSIGFMNELFFIFSILVIVNGNNLIDGVNGNLAFTNTIQLISIALLASVVGDDSVIHITILLLIPLLVFALFNFPFGKIFCGDTGAYLYGFAISALVIYLFGNYDQLFSWNAILILNYPSIELLFSFFRKKFIENKSPFAADARHLHSLIFIHMKKKNSNLKNNSIVILYLLFFIFSPLLTYFFHEELFVILFIISILIYVYIVMYTYFFKKL